MPTHHAPPVLDPSPKRTARKHIRLRFLVAIIFILGALAFVGLRMGTLLVVSNPERSDVILVLSGDRNDLRYSHGLELLRSGYGQKMTLDVPAGTIYGRTFAEYAAEFVAGTAGNQSSNISLCTIANDSTVEESSDVANCLAQIYPRPRSVLLVTNDFHTRRARSIFQSRLPQYRWSVAAVGDSYRFGREWWRHREWAKTCFYEWQKLAWWEFFESWRK